MPSRMTGANPETSKAIAYVPGGSALKVKVPWSDVRVDRGAISDGPERVTTTSRSAAPVVSRTDPAMAPVALLAVWALTDGVSTTHASHTAAASRAQPDPSLNVETTGCGISESSAEPIVHADCCEASTDQTSMPA